MIITLEHFNSLRSQCFACNELIILRHEGNLPSARILTYGCVTPGHYSSVVIHEHDSVGAIIINESISVDDSYVIINYEDNKVSVIKNEAAPSPINLNLVDKYRIDGMMVSRDGLRQLVHKASVVKHLR